MIPRQLTQTLLKRLGHRPAVALLGSRQVGKTTLARGLDAGKPSHYLDLERPSDLAKLADPELYLSGFANQLVILDEVQRVPDLFPILRSLVDERRRAGEQAPISGLSQSIADWAATRDHLDGPRGLC